ncbi:MAG: aminotransferase class I/II-fold pyridoxal phosphate-dependent enzyme [Granulosicoccus sp.]
MTDINTVRAKYEVFRQMNLSLNMERGQPADDNFDLSLALLDIVGPGDVITESGIDVRNYPGGILGLPEAREVFSEQLGIEPDEIMVGNSSSLELMSSFLSWALLKGVKGSSSGWVAGSPKLIVTVPGYDRHFSLAQSLGYELLTVPMSSQGPDMNTVEALASSDASVKGIYFVPNYSNPTGDCLSQKFAERLVAMKCAASDFTIFADDAYAVHHLVEPEAPAPNLLALAKASGLPDRVILFGSTSKVTFASAGICFAGMSDGNLKHWSKVLSQQSIGPNKIEQWRHVRFLKGYKDGIRGLMRDHASILKPKFDVVQDTLQSTIGNKGLASWTDPKGGYFVSLDTSRPVADRVVDLARQAGVALTPTGATFPGNVDPDNRNIRLAPTRPPLAEVEQAMQVVACCIELASAEYDAAQP